jgi:hypothetical protein
MVENITKQTEKYQGFVDSVKNEGYELDAE